MALASEEKIRYLSVRENIAFQTYSESAAPLVNWQEVDKRAREALAIIGLDINPDRKVGSLSIAEQQLIEITRSLIGDLKLLILDEPTIYSILRPVTRTSFD